MSSLSPLGGRGQPHTSSLEKAGTSFPTLRVLASPALDSLGSGAVDGELTPLGGRSDLIGTRHALGLALVSRLSSSAGGAVFESTSAPSPGEQPPASYFTPVTRSPAIRVENNDDLIM